MNIEPLVSIIIPTYNRKNMIERALNSCFQQTYSNIEIVVCDDQSTDGSYEYIEEKYGDRIVLCSSKGAGKGQNAARNVAISVARGDYLAFLDDDDYFLPNSIQDRVKCFGDDVVLVYGDIISKNKYWGKERKFFSVEDEERLRYVFENMALCAFVSIMIDKKVYDEKIGKLDEKLRAWTDDDLVVSIAPYGRLVHCGTVVTVMNNTVGSISHNYENMYYGCKDMVQKYKKEILKYTSLKRYCLWKVRLIFLWCNMKNTASDYPINVVRYKLAQFIYERVSYYFPMMGRPVKTRRMHSVDSPVRLIANWLESDENNEIFNYLKTRAISKVAIYGMGEMGEYFYDYIKDKNIDVECMIDKSANEMMSDIIAVTLEEFEEKKIQVDAIIITPIGYEKEIEEDIKKADIDCQLLSLTAIYADMN